MYLPKKKKKKKLRKCKTKQFGSENPEMQSSKCTQIPEHHVPGMKKFQRHIISRKKTKKQPPSGDSLDGDSSHPGNDSVLSLAKGENRLLSSST